LHRSVVTARQPGTAEDPLPKLSEAACVRLSDAFSGGARGDPHELDPDQSPDERDARESLCRASRSERDRQVEGARRHDLPGTRVRGPRGWHVPDLAHVRCADGNGQTTAHTDTYHGRFVRLVPNEKVVEVDEFETEDPAMRGEMTITITLANAAGGTELVAVHEGLPPGVSPADTRRDGEWRSTSSPPSSRELSRASPSLLPRFQAHPLERARPWRPLRRARAAGALHQGAARLIPVAALALTYRTQRFWTAR
jgi:hypothetical protein